MPDMREQMEKVKDKLGVRGDYVKKAEDVILAIADRNRQGNYRFSLTTSKLRKILSMVNQLYNEIIRSREEKLSGEFIDDLKYLKVRIVYEAGRDDKVVGRFVKEAKIIEEVDSIIREGTRKRFLAFARYMESLVAYHRYYGGREK